MKKFLINGGLVLFLIGSAGGSVFAYRSYRLANIAVDSIEHARFLIDSEESLGTVPASQAFSTGYLQAIFGDNPELLRKLRGVVQRGLSDPNRLSLGTVAAMLVTYRVNESGEVEDVATHVIGDFPMGKRKPGFHRDGYFKHLLDRNIWDCGNAIISFIGRDLIFFAEESVVEEQRELIESMFTGELDLIVEAIEQPYSYTLVIPNPRRLLPPQLRHHIQTVIVKGKLEQSQGSTEFVSLCANPKSAKYTLSVMEDTKLASEAILKTKFGGIVQETAWGPTIDNWWALEMVMASESSLMEQEENIVRVSSQYGRVMVNVILKCFERMGRDLAQIRGSLEEKKDPRLVDAEMQTRKGSHYWSESHRWGPNWPIAPPKMEEAENVPDPALDPAAVPATL